VILSVLDNIQPYQEESAPDDSDELNAFTMFFVRLWQCGLSLQADFPDKTFAGHSL